MCEMKDIECIKSFVKKLQYVIVCVVGVTVTQSKNKKLKKLPSLGQDKKMKKNNIL